MSRLIATLAVALSSSLLPMSRAVAQHEHEGHHHPVDSTARDPLSVSMGRMGSGTSWLPDEVRFPGWHGTLGSWDVMLHGAAYLEYNHQSGPRGDSQFGSVNWGMLVLGREVGGGRLQFRGMLSLDPLTVGDRGYPLLLQTGETYQGQPIIDRQHPHDVLMELGVMYQRALSKGLGLQLYAAASGEPALSPVAFMHRPSAMDDPTAPLAHHWHDATHVSFGVVTAGVFGRQWKLEGSVFNGREPDEDRWGIDGIRLDSWSARLTVNPSRHWSGSVGWGSLHSPEALHPDESVRRMTAAVMHGTRLGARGQWATTLAWGMNTHVEHDHDGASHEDDEHGDDGHGSGHDGEPSHSVLLESQAVLDARNSIFGRIEVSQRSASDLGITDAGAGDLDELHSVSSVSLGYIREVLAGRGMTTGVGIRGTLNVVPSAWREAYGSRTPTGLLLFLRVRPS